MPRYSLLLPLVVIPLLAGLAGFAPARAPVSASLPVADAVSRVPAPAAGLFLVASRGMQDPHFSHSVVYLVSHNEDGTLGLVVNRPSKLRLDDAVSDVEKRQGKDHAIYYGGPVKHDMITMLMRSERENALVRKISGDVFFSHDRRVLDRLLEEGKPADALRFYMGHAGWVRGQLQREVARGDWYVVEATPQAIFSTRPESLWHRLMEKIAPDGLYVGLAAPQPA